MRITRLLFFQLLSNRMDECHVKLVNLDALAQEIAEQTSHMGSKASLNAAIHAVNEHYTRVQELMDVKLQETDQVRFLALLGCVDTDVFLMDRKNQELYVEVNPALSFSQAALYLGELDEMSDFLDEWKSKAMSSIAGPLTVSGSADARRQLREHKVTIWFVGANE